MGITPAWARAVVCSLALCPGLISCGRDEPRPMTVVAPGVPGTAAVRTTEFEAGPGLPSISVRNPHEGNASAIEQGRRYFNWFNCTGCHGGQGGGGIGPPFADNDWIYGGEPAQIFESVVKGRPNGMPSFGRQIPDSQLWMIVAYVRSLSPGSEGGESQESGPAEGGEHDRTQRSRSGSDAN